MELYEAILIVTAAIAAGAINALVGSGTLITFPTLIALGYPPLLANISSNIGLVPGSISGAVAYRHELRGQGRRFLSLSLYAALGGLSGALLLLTLPRSAFDTIVPVLIATAMLLVLLQPRLTRWLAHRRRSENESHPTLRGLIYTTGIYGGYFGAAQGIILIAILGVALPDSLQRVNALKNALSAVINGVAAIFFIVFANFDWQIVALIATGATVGGALGGRYGRRLPAQALRGLIMVVGSIAILRLILG